MYNEKRTKNVARFARTFLVLRGFSDVNSLGCCPYGSMLIRS